MLSEKYNAAQQSKNEVMRNAAMNMDITGQCDTQARRNTAAEEIGELVERVSNFAAEVASLTGNKLNPIMRDCGPDEANKAECERSVPPLFQHLRYNLQSIEYQLRCIADCIQRTDI